MQSPMSYVMRKPVNAFMWTTKAQISLCLITEFVVRCLNSNTDRTSVKLMSKNKKMTKWKKWQKLIQGLYPNHMHISRPWRKHVQSFKKIVLKLYQELCSQGTHCLYTFTESDKSSQSGKSDKNKCKPYAHLQTMEKTCAKFQKDRYKIVWGIVLTKYPLSIHWGPLSIHWGRKMTLVHKVEKVTKITIISKPHAHPHTMKKTSAKFKKR